MTGRDETTQYSEREDTRSTHDAGDLAGEPAHADQTPDAADAPASESGQEPTVDLRLRVRRAPNFARFIIAGFVVGVLLGAVVDLLGPSLWGAGTSAMQQAGVDYSAGSATLFVAAVCGLLGGLGGAIVAVLLDRRS